MSENTLYLPSSARLRGVLERKREHFKSEALAMQQYSPDSWDKRVYGLCTGFGQEYALLHFLLKNGKVNCERVADILYNAPRGHKEAMAGSDGLNALAYQTMFTEEIFDKAREWREYMTPIEGMDGEFIGFHDRGYKITLPFPGRNDKDDSWLVLQIDDLLRIRSAYPEEHEITTPIPTNFLGDREGYFAMVHGSLSFPEIGVIDTGRKRLEALHRGDKIDILPKSSVGQVIKGSEVRGVELYFHDSRQDREQFLTYLRNLPATCSNPFEGMFRGGGKALTEMVREGGEEL